MKDLLFLKVLLWGEEIGRLNWDNRLRCTRFDFSPTYSARKTDLSLLSYSLRNKNVLLPVYSEDDYRKYKYLPAFLSDSLPDNWGSILFNQWVRSQNLTPNQVTPLQKLSYIGKRGMGALEFVPSFSDTQWKGIIDIEALSNLAKKIEEERETISLDPTEEITMEALRNLGTAPGGRMKKILLDIDKTTGEFQSGQAQVHANCRHFLLKFNDETTPGSELEKTYFDIARKAGINMTDCKLLEIEGKRHFLTERFDRINDQKIHTQTLAAMCPGTDSYEQIVTLMREMELPESDCQELYRRMLFNIIANNTDDHDRNISFMRTQNGSWRLSPAYDLTCIIDERGYKPNPFHVFSMEGKISGYTRKDIENFASKNGIRSAKIINEKVVDAFMEFKDLAITNQITKKWIGRIDDTIRLHLDELGFLKITRFFDLKTPSGHEVQKANIQMESNGAYKVTAQIDNTARQYYIQPKNILNKELSEIGFTNLDMDSLASIMDYTFFREEQNEKKLTDPHLESMEDKITRLLVKRASNPNAKTFSTTLRNLLTQYKNLIPQNNCQKYFNSLWHKAEIILKNKHINEQWQKDTYAELIDFANGKTRSLTEQIHL